jgi:O-antigen ligase
MSQTIASSEFVRLQVAGSDRTPKTGAAQAGASRKRILWARISILLTVISCIKFFVQDNFGFGQFDYTQAFIETSALGLGFVAALCALGATGLRGKLGTDDLLFLAFILLSFAWSWRSWNLNLTLVHTLCFLCLVFNVRVALYAAGVRETFAALYWSTFSVLMAGVIASVILPDLYPIFPTFVYDGGRRRFIYFLQHPIEVADIMVLNLIVGTLLKIRYRAIVQLLCGAALLGTASRASEVCGVVIILTAAYQATGTSRRWKSLLRAAMIVATLAVLMWLAADPTSLVRTLFPTADSSLLMAESANDQSLNGRLPLWIKVVDTLSIDNLMGYGFHGYRKLVFDLSGWAAHAHNSVLDAILTAGYVGGACLIGWVLYGLFRPRRGIQPVPPAMCRCVLLYAFVVGMMGPTLLDPYAVMYITAAIYAVPGAVSQRRYRNLAPVGARGGRTLVYPRQRSVNSALS